MVANSNRYRWASVMPSDSVVCLVNIVEMCSDTCDLSVGTGTWERGWVWGSVPVFLFLNTVGSLLHVILHEVYIEDTPIYRSEREREIIIMFNCMYMLLILYNTRTLWNLYSYY